MERGFVIGYGDSYVKDLSLTETGEQAARELAPKKDAAP